MWKKNFWIDSLCKNCDLSIHSDEFCAQYLSSELINVFMEGAEKQCLVNCGMSVYNAYWSVLKWYMNQSIPTGTVIAGWIIVCLYKRNLTWKLENIQYFHSWHTILQMFGVLDYVVSIVSNLMASFKSAWMPCSVEGRLRVKLSRLYLRQSAVILLHSIDVYWSCVPWSTYPNLIVKIAQPVLLNWFLINPPQCCKSFV